MKTTTGTYGSDSHESATTYFRRGDFPRPLASNADHDLHTGVQEVDDFANRTFGSSTAKLKERDCAPIRERIERNFEALTVALSTDENLSKVEPQRVREYLGWLKESPTVYEGLKLLESEIGKHQDLHYHGTSHTWDVLKEYSVIALREGLTLEQLKLGAVGSVFHDLGFIHKRPGNEPYGAACLVSLQDSFQREFSDRDGSRLRDIVQSILDTRPLPVEGQPGVFVPKLSAGTHGTIASCILDADVANFGRTDFLEKATRVYAEIKGLTSVPSLKQMLDFEPGREFLRNTLEMLHTHEFWTASARELHNPGKQANIALLEKHLGISSQHA